MYFNLYILFITISIFCLILIRLTAFYYRQQRESIEILKSKVIESIESDRKRIANDLHDSCGNILVEFAFQISSLKQQFLSHPNLTFRLDELTVKIQKLNQEIINSIENIYPKELLENRWEEAILNLVYRFKLNGKGVVCDIQKCSNLPTSTQLQSFRIIQELITNIFKHAFPDHLTVQIFESQGFVFVIFVYNESVKLDFKSQNSKSRGIDSINDRLAEIKGVLEGPLNIGSRSETDLFELTLTFPVKND